MEVQQEDKSSSKVFKPSIVSIVVIGLFLIGFISIFTYSFLTAPVPLGSRIVWSIGTLPFHLAVILLIYFYYKNTYIEIAANRLVYKTPMNTKKEYLFSEMENIYVFWPRIRGRGTPQSGLIIGIQGRPEIKITGFGKSDMDQIAALVGERVKRTEKSAQPFYSGRKPISLTKLDKVVPYIVLVIVLILVGLTIYFLFFNPS